MVYDFSLVHVEVAAGVATATIDNPPINLMTLELFGQLAALADLVEQDPEVRVLVFRSADPDFFIAHFDVELILRFPTSGPVERETEHNAFHQMCERLRTMPKATICAIAGRVGGGGSELAASCDMRFGLLGKTVVNQMEVPIGILPGGSGTQRLPRLLGRGRALELILGGADLDAATAERWGYLNRAFATVGRVGRTRCRSRRPHRRCASRGGAFGQGCRAARGAADGRRAVRRGRTLPRSAAHRRSRSGDACIPGRRGTDPRR